MRANQRRNLSRGHQSSPDNAAPDRSGTVPERVAVISVDDDTDIDADDSGHYRGWAFTDRCDVSGCPNRIFWPDADLVDMNSGQSFPGLFCEEHTIAYLHRHR